ncbi:MAG: glycoside hydrolase family protein [Theionarchaea archaeon]|nr:glycoside hydrolase family protein [Theionarchaea archaeon]
MHFIDRLLPAPVDGGFRMEDYWVWCGSCIRGEDGRYHLFASRWPKRFPFFEGYIVASEVVRAVSDTPSGPYEFEEVVLPVRGEDCWDGRMTHNPTIHRMGDTYLLFYIGARYLGPVPSPDVVAGRYFPQKNESYSSIRIGMATSRSVYGPWERPESPVLDIREGSWDNSVVTNPAPCMPGDGSILLYYRSNTPEGLRIGVARSPKLGAPFSRLSEEPVLKFGGGKHVEDPFVWRTGDLFEMVAKDLNGKLTGENHAGIHATSLDGIDWKLSEPPKAYSRRVMWNDGSTTVQGSLERPQLLIEDGRPTHLFMATADGPGGFRSATRTWNMVIPLAV